MGYSKYDETTAIQMLNAAGIDDGFQIGVPNYKVNQVMDQGQAGLDAILRIANPTTPAGGELSSYINELRSRPMQQFRDINKPGIGSWKYSNGSWNFAEDDIAKVAREKKEGMLSGFYGDISRPLAERLDGFSKEYATQATDAAAPGVIQNMVSKGMSPTEAMAMVGADASKKGQLLAYDIDSNRQNQLTNIISMLEGGMNTDRAAEMNMGSMAMGNQQATAALSNARDFNVGQLLGSLGQLQQGDTRLGQTQQQLDYNRELADKNSQGNSSGKLVDFAMDWGPTLLSMWNPAVGAAAKTGVNMYRNDNAPINTLPYANVVS